MVEVHRVAQVDGVEFVERGDRTAPERGIEIDDVYFEL
jgi:hypothetical protein